MNFVNALKVAWKAILTNKSRSILTMLGVIIGVGSVILLVSIGNGLQVYIEDTFEDLGSNAIYVYPTEVFGENGFGQQDERSFVAAKQFSTKNLQDLQRYRRQIKEVLPESVRGTTVRYRDTQKDITVTGTTQVYENVRNTKTIKGRFFSDSETRSGQRVAVLGYKIAQDLFGNSDPVGRTIRLKGVNFEVIGVAEEKGGGAFGGPPFDNYIFIPLEAFFRLFDSTDINSFTVQVRNKEEIPEVIDLLTEYLEETDNRDEKEYDVIDQREILDTINQVLGVLTVGLGGIAAISLLVGGIGIMNIMLVSVTERTREIGLRKAIGATPNQILLQFLIESSLLSLVGGAIGVGLASLASFLMVSLADFPSAITWQSILLAFGVSVSVGVIFGVAPARKASRLSPIEALRSE